MWYLIALAIGVVIGWQFPQPEWAKNAWAWVKTKTFGPSSS